MVLVHWDMTQNSRDNFHDVFRKDDPQGPEVSDSSLRVTRTPRSPRACPRSPEKRQKITPVLQATVALNHAYHRGRGRREGAGESLEQRV